ncbi:MAG TPA: glycosyltransferase [Streptosporangiaceae bacterium]|nr:glycosyltransferase [Streptosporangiaceae bacterium]
MPFLAGAAVLAAIAWAYLLAGHGGYWRTDQRLPRAHRDPAEWPSVVAVVPARNEAAVLPVTLPTLLSQDYPGQFSVVLVDDGSTDGTAGTAAALSDGTGRALRIAAAGDPPAGWAGKVHAMAEGLRAAGECDYVLFTDADISYAPGTLTMLVRGAVADNRVIVSQMALLRADCGWERFIVPAFTYFFAQLYPFRRVNRPGSRTAAAAGGCMLVRREALTSAGGLARIRGARIDDVALGGLLKRPPSRARCWLGFTTQVRSRRPYPRLADLWDMIARSAYTQLRYSPALLAGTLGGLLWLYAVPPATAICGLAVAAAETSVAAGTGLAAAWCAAAGLAGWLLMAVSYLPVLRLYRLPPWRAPILPVIALLYAAMTADSARRHYAGRGGEWKGRTVPARSGQRRANQP